MHVRTARTGGQPTAARLSGQNESVYQHEDTQTPERMAKQVGGMASGDSHMCLWYSTTFQYLEMSASEQRSTHLER
jgi:hypothetical protein